MTGTPLKATLVAPLKALPLMDTVIPAGPLRGVNEVIVGVTLKSVEETPRGPSELLTLIGPLTTPMFEKSGTCKVNCVSLFTWKLTTG